MYICVKSTLFWCSVTGLSGKNNLLIENGANEKRLIVFIQFVSRLLLIEVLTCDEKLASEIVGSLLAE